MLHVGIIGAGHFAARHVAALGAMGERVRLSLAARRNVAEPFPEAEALGARVVAPEALLKSLDIDAVIICSPNFLHRGQAEAALAAGKHVFCEKPLALSVEDVDAVIATAEAAGRVLMVGHTTRYSPVYAATADYLQSGCLGEPLTVYTSRLHTGVEREWRMDPQMGGGVGFDLLIHDLDLLNWYLGRPKTVVARGHRHPRGAHDHLSALFTFPTGVNAVAEGSFLLREPAGLTALLRIVCEHGHIEVDSHRAEARVFQEGKPEEALPLISESETPTGVAGELAEFVETVERGVRGRLRIEDARQAVESAALTVQAADTGGVVHFPE
jgi:myo-inositol 2-dehydrogenase/D-chiro-inositol 1-dehydrogenase